MKLDDEKRAWQQLNSELADSRFGECTVTVVTQTTKLESALRRRDWIEVATVLFVTGFFILFLIFSQAPAIMKIGTAMMILGALQAVAFMFWMRHREPRSNPDSSLKDFCRAELIRVDRQIKMAKYVTWWYSTPILSGDFVFLWGAMAGLPATTFWGFLAALGACFCWMANAIYRLNSRAAEKSLVPMRSELAALAQSLEIEVAEQDVNSESA